MSGTGTARTLAAADWAVIIAFFATMVAIGIVCARRQKSSDQFFGGDKSMPWYLAGILWGTVPYEMTSILNSAACTA